MSPSKPVSRRPRPAVRKRVAKRPEAGAKAAASRKSAPARPAALPRPAPRSDPKLYRPISVVADVVGVKPHVLRYWETQFNMLRPKKNRAGNRMYRPDEVKLLMRIKELLYDRRFTIAGARRHLLAQRKEPALRQPEAVAGETERKLLLHEVKAGLRQILGRLRGPGAET